jgi:hypothetical protein
LTNSSSKPKQNLIEAGERNLPFFFCASLIFLFERMCLGRMQLTAWAGKVALAEETDFRISRNHRARYYYHDNHNRQFQLALADQIKNDQRSA